MSIIVIILFILYILFFPGLFASFVVFKQGQVDIIERFALSFGISIALVPLIVFYTNLFGVPITTTSVILQATIIMACAGIILILKHLKKKQ